jgi:hypothetical protein
VHFPEQRFGVIVLANSGIASPVRAAFDVADIYLEKDLGPRAAADAPVAARAVDVTPAILQKYVGTYKLGPGWYVRVRLDGRSLRSQASGENEVAMTARSDSTFWVDAYGATITFQRDGSGRVTHFVYRDRRAPRMEENAATQPARLADYAGTYESAELQTTYIVEERAGSLVMRHRRHGTVPLTAGWKATSRRRSGFSSRWSSSGCGGTRDRVRGERRRAQSQHSVCQSAIGADRIAHQQWRRHSLEGMAKAGEDGQLSWSSAR